MNYIRTKDGRIIIIETEDFIDIKEYNKLTEGTIYEYDSEEVEIVKRADTIEELIDEYVFVSKTGKNIIFREDMFFPTPQEARGKMDCYGAVWTEWGLKYVAKMNKDGEFELI